MERYQEWLLVADDDLRASKSLLNDLILAPAIYHTQQCAEKSFKAYLAYKQERIKKTHDLVALLNDCSDFDVEFLELIQAAVHRGYPQIADFLTIKKLYDPKCRLKNTFYTNYLQ